MAGAVNIEISVTPAGLRRYCATHAVTATAIGRTLGVSQQYVSAAMASDRNGIPVSERQLERIREAAMQIVYAREER